MLIDSFLEYLRVERNYSSKTLVSYKNDLRQFEDFFLRKDTELSWQAIDADVIRQWVMQMMAEKYTATSVNRKLSALRSFFRYLLLRKQIKSSPMMNVKGPKKKKPLPVFVKERDMDKLLDDVEREGFFPHRKGFDVPKRNREFIECFRKYLQKQQANGLSY